MRLYQINLSMDKHPLPKELEWLENTKQTFASREIRVSKTELALVDVLSDWTRKVYLRKEINNKVLLSKDRDGLNSTI